jgi:hypothetical protein
VVRMLLEARAAPNLADSFGQTPLMVVASAWNAELAAALSEAKADVNAAACDGTTALSIATRCRNVEACTALVARLNAKCDDASRQFLAEHRIDAKGQHMPGAAAAAAARPTNAATPGTGTGSGSGGGGGDLFFDFDELDGTATDDAPARSATSREKARLLLLHDALAVLDIPRARALLAAKVDVNARIESPVVDSDDEAAAAAAAAAAAGADAAGGGGGGGDGGGSVATGSGSSLGNASASGRGGGDGGGGGGATTTSSSASDGVAAAVAAAAAAGRAAAAAKAKERRPGADLPPGSDTLLYVLVLLLAERVCTVFRVFLTELTLMTVDTFF